MAAVSALQAGGIAPTLVSADNSNSIIIELLRAPTGSESVFASGKVDINLQTGNIHLELHQATADSVYALIFVSGSPSANLQVGMFTTTDSGEGNLQIPSALSGGTYVGFFELTRAGIVEFFSAPTSITISGTAPATTSQTSTTATQTTATQTTIYQTTASTSTSQTQPSTVISSTNTAQVQINVDPTLETINAGAFAKFEIHVKAEGEVSILLAAKGVPPDSVAIFTPPTGVADAEFRSTLTIVTSTTTPQGTYGVTLVASINEQEFDSQIGLEVTASSTVTETTSSSSISVSVGTALALTLYTNAHQYSANDTVKVEGHVADDGGNAVENAAVTVQIDATTGAELYSQQDLSTDLAGIFQFNFKLPASATAGTYTIFASASKPGYVSATTHTTFVVGTSSTPSIIIKTVYAGDSSGNPSAVFTAGQTVYIWVTVQNVGATFQGVIWVQVRDPNGVPVSIQIRISQLTSGETITDGFGFTFLGLATVGLYSVNALVSDKLISQGGTFFANTNTEFALTD
jgi:hypothetical protein